NYLGQLDRQINASNAKIQSLIQNLDQLKHSLKYQKPLEEAANLTQRLEKNHPPLLYISQSKIMNINIPFIDKDLSNVFVLDNNEYLPLGLHQLYQSVVSARLELDSLKNTKDRIN